MPTNPVALPSLDDDSLRSALAEARRRLADLDGRIEALRSDRRPVAQEAELLEQLLVLRSPDSTAPKTTAKFSGAKSSGPVLSRGQHIHPAVKEAIHELEAAEHPLHISELMRLLQARDVQIPGAGAQANLIAHLTRNSQIVRPSRGMYALASWGASDQPAVKRATRRRLRGPSVTTDEKLTSEAGDQ
jgi:hypothetical protein